MLEVKELVAGYPGRVMPTRWNFSSGIGECVLLAGSNGSGKSTLLKTLAGLLAPVSGEIRFDGKAISYPADRGTVMLVPTRLPKIKGFTVKDFIAAGTLAGRFMGRLSPAELEAMDEAMVLLGISALSDRDISGLSDGEFQKACIAAALSRRPKVLLLDEPTAFLDVESRISVLATLRNIADGGCTAIFSSHDVVESLKVATRVIAIRTDGSQLVSDTTPESMSAAVRSSFKNPSA